MRYEIRDDIISLDRYFIAMKHESFLHDIYISGGYCFLKQIKQYRSNLRFLRELEDHKLVKLKNYNSKDKYCVLTNSTIKYFQFKDSKEDYDDVDNLKKTQLKQNPNDKTLFASALKYDLLKSDILDINFESVIKSITINYSKQYNKNFELLLNKDKQVDQLQDNILSIKTFKNRVDALINSLDIPSDDFTKKAIQEEMSKVLGLKKTELDQVESEYKAIIDDDNMKRLPGVIDCFTNLYKQSKIIPYFDGEMINLYILDTGSGHTAYSYMNYVHNIWDCGLRFKGVNFFIVSYDKGRADSLKKRFDEAIVLREKADEDMLIYEKKSFKEPNARRYRSQWKYTPSDLYLRKEKIYNQFKPLNNVQVIDCSFYLENTKSLAVYDDDYIKKKDVESIEELRKFFMSHEKWESNPNLNDEIKPNFIEK